MGLSALSWLMLSHLDAIAEVFKLSRWVNQGKFFNWVANHKVLTLLTTECLNYGHTGIDNPNAVTFAGGATIVNAIVIFCVIWPLNKLRGKSIQLKDVA